MNLQKLLLCLLMIQVTAANAQFSDRDLENASFQVKNKYIQNPYKINHVKSVLYKNKSNKGYINTYESLMNTLSYVTMTTEFSKHGKVKDVNIYQYKNDTLVTDHYVLHHGKDTFNSAIYHYDNQNRRISSKWKIALFWVPVREWRYDYNNKDLVTTARYIDKNGNDKLKYEYDYFDNGSKKETRYYKRNKLKNKWTFECDPKGELVKKVKTGNYCTKRTLNNDGSFIEVFEYKFDNGKPTKTICYYTADTIMTKYEEYKKNGELKKKYEYTYDKNGNDTQILYFKHGKLKKRYIYTYNDKNLRSNSDVFDGKGKLQISCISEYTYY